MEQSNRIQRSEVWEQIYKVVKSIPRADCNGMDAPDAPSVATELEELFLKLLPIQHVRQQSELLLQAYKEGFDAATESLISANKVVQERKLQQ
jgi:hypothetical protein